MEIEIIKGMIENSSWVDPENKNFYKFFNIDELAINEKNHSHYSIKNKNNQVEIKLGQERKYFIEYINDFNLHFYNDEEKFRIIPA